MKFRVDFVLQGKRKRAAFVFARWLEPVSFQLTEGAKLGGVAIRPCITKPRAIDAEGNPDHSAFAFTLADKRDADKFSTGSIVELEP